MEWEKQHAPTSSPFEPWCPLFGPLTIVQGNPGSSTVRCAEIIISARHMWEVGLGDDEHYSCPRYCENNRDGVFLPVPESLPNYSLWACLSANTILKSWPSLTQNYSYPRRDPRTFEEDKCVSNGMEYFVWDMAMEEVRCSQSWGYIYDRIPDFAIIAMFALSQAWDVLKSIIAWGHSEAVFEDVKMAEELLSVGQVLARREQDLVERRVLQSRRGRRKGAAARKRLAPSVRAIMEDQNKAVSSYLRLAEEIVQKDYSHLMKDPDPTKAPKKVDSLRHTLADVYPDLFGTN